jgi:hypothetical protein
MKDRLHHGLYAPAFVMKEPQDLSKLELRMIRRLDGWPVLKSYTIGEATELPKDSWRHCYIRYIRACACLEMVQLAKA